jgi:hypothetical protein
MPLAVYSLRYYDDAGHLILYRFQQFATDSEAYQAALTYCDGYSRVDIERNDKPIWRGPARQLAAILESR